MNWWNKNKLKLSLAPALIFWVVSMLCFVFGLSFKNPIGYSLLGWDVSMWVAVGLSIGNTVIQIIGNDQEREKMGSVMYVGWMASYILGIGSNVNTLLGILNIDNVYLEWTIALSLGSMIEVMPERLLVTFLKSLTDRSSKFKNQNNPGHINSPSMREFLGRNNPNKHDVSQKSNYQPKHRPNNDNHRVNIPFPIEDVIEENQEFKPVGY